MQIQNYKPVEGHKTILANFDIMVPKWGGFIIRKCKLGQKEGHRFILMPSWEYEKDGKKKYASYVTFSEREMSDKFQAQVLLAIDELARTQQTIPEPEQANQVPF